MTSTQPHTRVPGSVPRARSAAGLIDAIDRFDPQVERGSIAFVEQLGEALGARNAAIFSPKVDDGRWDLEFAHWSGRAAAERAAAHRRLLRATSSDDVGFAAYDPLAVEVQQRNRALTVADLIALSPGARIPHARVQAAIGAHAEDQLRVLICRGPRLLAWVGAVRPEPFTQLDRQLLQSIVPALQARLDHIEVENRLCDAALLDFVLETWPEPALLVSGNYRIEHTNRRAAALLDNPANGGILGDLRAALRDGTRVPGIQVSELVRQGMPTYRLVRLTNGSHRHNASIARAAHTWCLGPRSARVLEYLVQGLSNKEIAQALGCSEVTVERHLTGMYRKAGTDSRVGLIVALDSL